MKLKELKQILKETVREVIQEELKEILLEAIKSSKTTSLPLMESFKNTATPQLPMSSQDKRNAYKDILGETAAGFNTNNIQNFKPNLGMDMTNGSLPEGDVGMEQIMNLMNPNR